MNVVYLSPHVDLHTMSWINALQYLLICEVMV